MIYIYQILWTVSYRFLVFFTLSSCIYWWMENPARFKWSIKRLKTGFIQRNAILLRRNDIFKLIKIKNITEILTIPKKSGESSNCYQQTCILPPPILMCLTPLDTLYSILTGKGNQCFLSFLFSLPAKLKENMLQSRDQYLS